LTVLGLTISHYNKSITCQAENIKSQGLLSTTSSMSTLYCV